MHDGATSIGGASVIRAHIHAAVRPGVAVREAVYTPQDVRLLDWIEAPGTADSELFRLVTMLIKRARSIDFLLNRIQPAGAWLTQ